MGEVVPLISPSPSPISFSLVGEGGEDWVGGEMRGKVGGRGGSSHFTFTLTHFLFFSG